MGLRQTLALRVLASWAIPVLGLTLLVLGIPEFGEGWWALILVGLVSLPIIVIVLVTALCFPRSVLAKPTSWAATAVLVSMAAGFMVAALAGLVFASMIAVTAFLLFVGSLRFWPHKIDRAKGRYVGVARGHDE